jgi:hypothetical protein
MNLADMDLRRIFPAKWQKIVSHREKRFEQEEDREKQSHGVTSEQEGRGKGD